MATSINALRKKYENHTNMLSHKSVYAIFFWILISLEFSSCTFKEVEFKKVESFKILNTDKKGATAELNVILKNPNRMSITVSSIDLILVVNQSNIGNIKLAEKVKIAARSEQSHRFVVNAKYSDIAVGGFSSLLSIIMSKKVNIACSGNIQARALGISKTMPISYKGDVPLGSIIDM
jgi:LEA14-like dessication related protein